jgi:hypothetical protein
LKGNLIVRNYYTVTTLKFKVVKLLNDEWLKKRLNGLPKNSAAAPAAAPAAAAGAKAYR